MVSTVITYYSCQVSRGYHLRSHSDWSQKEQSKMENLRYLKISILIACFGLRCISSKLVGNESTFGELCRFEGICLNCTDGGCDDMCNFYDNNCCENRSSTNTILKQWQYSCVRKFPDMYDLHLDCRGSFDGIYGVYMVTKCSELWTDEHISIKCENNSDNDILSRIPVYDDSNEIVSYKNMYCAFCNWLSLRHIRFWKFDLMCDEHAQAINEYCFVRLIYRKHRMCAFNVIKNCDVTGTINPAVRDKCENGLTQNVYVWKNVRTYSVYKNEFCAQCNHETGQLQCWAFQAFTCWPQDLPPYRRVEAMIELDINQIRNYKIKPSTKLYNSTCGEGVLYDPFGKTCLNVSCLPLIDSCLSGMCHLVSLQTSDFMIQNDSSLNVSILGDKISKGRYFIKGSNVFVCLNDKQYFTFKMIQETTQTEETTTEFLPRTTSNTNDQMPLSSEQACGKMSTGKLVALLFVWNVLAEVFSFTP